MPTITNGTKVDQIVTSCIYRIATGAWEAESRLPSLRQAAAMWTVDPLTVKRAYVELQRRGLVRIVPKSGAFVLGNERLPRLRQYSRLLDALYAHFREEIDEKVGISALGAFRYFVQMAQEHASRSPECVFVECTAPQARQISNEISRHLGVPCLGLDLSDLVDGRSCIGPDARLVMTTGFHVAEVREVVVQVGLKQEPLILQITVSFAQKAIARLMKIGDPITLFCLDANQGDMVVKEIVGSCGNRAEFPEISVREATVTQIESLLEELLGDPHPPCPSAAVVVSPMLWAALTPPWQECVRVVPYTFDVQDASIEQAAHCLGLPLGPGALI